MTLKSISSGVVHTVPKDIKVLLVEKPPLLAAWEDITPLARNEWLCWIESAKKAETRLSRINRLVNDLPNGKRRPCCWPGCPHR
jgi:uncharacterized protein YdeI (YjbR/CyaY-like superfamily)